MSRSPRIPPNTKLYILDEQLINGKCLGFLNCYLTIDDAIAARGSRQCNILLYNVPQGDFVHGLWFSPDSGSSVEERSTVVIGPGMFVNFNFINPNKSDSLREPDSIVTLKQDNFFYFVFNDQMKGDKRFLDTLTYPCICYKYKGNRCIINKSLALALQIDNSENIHYKGAKSNEMAEELSNLYISVQSTGAIAIAIDVSLGKKFIIQGNEHLVFKLVSKESNYYVYCTALGMLYFCCINQLLEIVPIEQQLPIGTIINHSNQQLSEQIQLYIQHDS